MCPLRPTLNTPLPLSILKKILMTEQIYIQTWNLLCDTSNTQIVPFRFSKSIDTETWNLVYDTTELSQTYTLILPSTTNYVRRHQPDIKAFVQFNEFKEKLCAWVEYNIFLLEWHKYLFSSRNSTFSFWLLWPLINLWCSRIRMFVCSYACLITCLITCKCMFKFLHQNKTNLLYKIGNFKQFLLFLL